MMHLICEHLATPRKGSHDYLLLSKGSERVLCCLECYTTPNAKTKLVSQRFFDALVTEMGLMQKRQGSELNMRKI